MRRPEGFLDDGQVSMNERMKEIPARSRGVACDLGPELVDRRELALTPQSVQEPDADWGAI